MLSNFQGIMATTCKIFVLLPVSVLNIIAHNQVALKKMRRNLVSVNLKLKLNYLLRVNQILFHWRFYVGGSLASCLTFGPFLRLDPYLATWLLIKNSPHSDICNANTWHSPISRSTTSTISWDVKMRLTYNVIDLLIMKHVHNDDDNPTPKQSITYYSISIWGRREF